MPGENMFCWKSYGMGSPAKVVLLACGSYNPVTNMHLRMFEIARDALSKSGRYHVASGIMSPVGDGYNKKDLESAKHRCEMLKAALKSSDWIKMDTWECMQSTWSTTAKVLRHHKQQLEVQYNFTHKPSPSKRRRRQLNSGSANQSCPSYYSPSSGDPENILHPCILAERIEIKKGRRTWPHTWAELKLEVLGRAAQISQPCLSDIPENQVPQIETEGDHVPSIKLLCGADLLESFAVPGLWEEEDIEYIVGTHGLVVITRSGSDPLKFIYESDILTKFQENIFIVTEWIYNDISSTKVRRALRRGDSVKYVLQDSVIEYIREHQLYGAPDNKYINHMMPSPNQEPISTEVEDDGSSSASEISVVLRSSNQDGYSSLHLPLHRMSTNLDKRSPVTTRSKSTHSSSRLPCFSDIGMLVKRVKNYNLRASIARQHQK